MTSNFIKLYDTSSTADSAFFLNEGNAYFYASNVDKYQINGKNLILGATEIIMKHLVGKETNRVETAVADGGSIVKKMSAEKFLEGINTFSFSLNVSIVLAKQVFLTNRILNTNIKSLSQDELKVKEYSVEFYKIMKRLKQEYAKRKLPWIKELSKGFETNLTYKRGEAYFKSEEPTKITAGTNISDKDVEYPKGTVICEQDTVGHEMFILKSGAIDVLLDKTRVATIDEVGTVIGEIALLLGEKRTATLKAKNNVLITKITKKDLKEVAEKQGDIVTSVARTLAKRHYYNIIKIGDVNKSIAERSIDEEIEGKKKIPIANIARKDLSSLRNKVEDVSRQKQADFLDDLVNTF